LSGGSGVRDALWEKLIGIGIDKASFYTRISNTAIQRMSVLLEKPVPDVVVLMLTYKDETVKDAMDVFEEIKDIPTNYFGFKDIGLPVEAMNILKDNMKNAGKKTFLKVVRYSEKEVLESAELAVNVGFDYLMGTVYGDSIWDVIDKKIKYMPFCGKVYDHPSVLGGSVDEIVEDVKRIERKGIPIRTRLPCF